jgi:hypothetical protein
MLYWIKLRIQCNSAANKSHNGFYFWRENLKLQKVMISDREEIYLRNKPSVGIHLFTGADAGNSRSNLCLSHLPGCHRLLRWPTYPSEWSGPTFIINLSKTYKAIYIIIMTFYRLLIGNSSKNKAMFRYGYSSTAWDHGYYHQTHLEFLFIPS